MTSIPQFRRYVGIDYSGAETPDSPLKGLRVYVATPADPPRELMPSPHPRKHWTRCGIAEWIVELVRMPEPVLIGIDHGFSFPIRYFKEHGLPLNWPEFLDDFQAHWPTDENYMYVDFVREGVYGNGGPRWGSPRWRRVTEVRARAKSVFHFDIPGSVAKSTHAGLTWLRYIRNQARDLVHFWPFDGWELPPGRSVIAEVYPRLVSGAYPREDRDRDQHDAYSIAAWLREVDMRNSHQTETLDSFVSPALTDYERQSAAIEGWILGQK